MAAHVDDQGEMVCVSVSLHLEAGHHGVTTAQGRLKDFMVQKVPGEGSQ